jgi:hypothetical protein
VLFEKKECGGFDGFEALDVRKMHARRRLSEFENDFYFHGDVTWERAHADSAAGSDAQIGSPNVSEELGTRVDDLGMVVEIGGGVDHSEGFDDAADFIEGAEFVAEGAEEGESALARRVLPLFEVEVFANDAGDVRSVVLHWAVTGDVEKVPGDDHGFINVDGFRDCGKGQAQFDDAGFGSRDGGAHARVGCNSHAIGRSVAEKP